MMMLESDSDSDSGPPPPILQNIVSTVDLGCKVNLKQIASMARNSEYNPNRFQAVIMRIREPRTTALIFSSGKMVVTGAKSEQLARVAARKYARIVQKVGVPAEFKDFKIQNIVASCDVKFTIRLETLHAFCKPPGCATYDPECFPGLIYRVLKPKVVMLIFVSGKVVITGAKDFKNHTLKAWEKMYPLIAQHRKNCANLVSSSAQENSDLRPQKGRTKRT